MRSIFMITFLLNSTACLFSQSKDTLPQPFATKSKMNFSNVIGWKDGNTPKAPEGFKVSLFASDLRNPRWLCVTPNGDVLVAESNSRYGLLKRIGAFFVGAHKSNSLRKSADRITLFRDNDKNGTPDERHVLLEDLNQPFGMLVLNDYLYVANTGELLRFPYKPGDVKISNAGESISFLPAGKVNRHWTRNIIASKDGKKIYVAVGSGDNHGEKGMKHEVDKAAILEMNPDGTAKRVYASGLRNPVGMDWHPETGVLYTSVNERDLLGDDLVPDYLTSVKDGGFYGWPWSWFGNHKDPRVKPQRDDLVEKAIVPDHDLGSHTASLGLTFYKGNRFPERYRNGAFVAQHGSWNRSVISGYKVVFVPFRDGKPSGKTEDFLTGFISNLEKEKVHGRPVCVLEMPDGSLLITDDTSNRIWRVEYTGK